MTEIFTTKIGIIVVYFLPFPNMPLLLLPGRMFFSFRKIKIIFLRKISLVGKLFAMLLKYR